MGSMEEVEIVVSLIEAEHEKECPTEKMRSMSVVG